jgi:hypothetical protein
VGNVILKRKGLRATDKKEPTNSELWQGFIRIRPTPIPHHKAVLLSTAFLSPLLLILGMKGFYWMMGILFGFIDYL